MGGTHGQSSEIWWGVKGTNKSLGDVFMHRRTAFLSQCTVWFNTVAMRRLMTNGILVHIPGRTEARCRNGSGESCDPW